MQERENDINGHLFRSIHVGDKPPVDEELYESNLLLASRRLLILRLSSIRISNLLRVDSIFYNGTRNN